MKSIYRTLAVASLCGVLMFPPSLEARGRNNANNNSRPASSAPSSRPGNSGRPTGNRPGGGNHNTGNRPSGGNHNPGNRPGGNHNPGNRPGGNHNPGNRPGGNHNPGNRPGGGNHNPGNRPGSGNHNHGYRPGGNHGPNHNNHHHFRPGPPPQAFHRPTLPPGHHYYRPVPPPPSFRPYASWPTISSILGFRLGSAIGAVYGSLLSGGYNVLASTSNALYLNNVNMMNILWPEATLSFNSVGSLCGSEFIYPSSFNDRMIFNNLYNNLTLNYGTPYSVTNNGPYSTTASWWGPNGQYIRLNYSTDIGYDGMTRFYTTLNFGVY